MKIEADFSRQHPNMGHDFPDASANYPTTAFQGRLVHFIYQSGIVVGLIFYFKATKERSQWGRSLATKARRHEVNGGGIWPRRHEDTKSMLEGFFGHEDTKSVNWGRNLLQRNQGSWMGSVAATPCGSVSEIRLFCALRWAKWLCRSFQLRLLCLECTF